MRYTIVWSVLIVVALLGVGWVIRSNNLAQEAAFAPKEEAVRRKTFEESKAYNAGLAQEISAMQLEYIRATPEQQAAMRSVILHRVADYDISRFPDDTRKFIESLNARTP